MLVDGTEPGDEPLVRLMERHMERDKQIKLLEGATSRRDHRVADWMADKDVRAAIKFYHEQLMEIRSPKLAACR